MQFKINKLILNKKIRVVDSTWGFMTRTSNSTSHHWSVVAKANSGTPSTAMECYWHRCCEHWHIAGRNAATALAGSQKGPHWVRSALYLLHISCYCNSNQILATLFPVLFSKSTLKTECVVSDYIRSKPTEGSMTVLCQNCIVWRLFPKLCSYAERHICFLSSELWFSQIISVFNWKPLHNPSSGCGLMRKTDKSRIKYQTITTLFCFTVKKFYLNHLIHWSIAF